MKKSLPQIALNFMTENGHQPIAGIQQGEEVPLTNENVEAISLTANVPAGVGIRVKSLKKEVLSVEGLESEALTTPQAEEMPQSLPAAGNKTGKSKRGRKSLKQATAEADLIDIPDDESLFRKQYYTMGEVAGMFRVNQSLLRFWETEFNILQPRKNKKGDRYFRPVDIKNLHLIYHLLRQRKYTIEGAKEFLKKNKKAEERFEAIQRLQQVRAFLLEWKSQL
jgi:DNA-binding transcriptional MerR regulator